MRDKHLTGSCLPRRRPRPLGSNRKERWRRASNPFEVVNELALPSGSIDDYTWSPKCALSGTRVEHRRLAEAEGAVLSSKILGIRVPFARRGALGGLIGGHWRTSSLTQVRVVVSGMRASSGVA